MNLSTMGQQAASGRTTLRLVIAGLGLVGRRHAKVINAMAGAELVAIVDPSADAKDYAAQHGIALFDNVPDMLAQITPDGVVLATPTLLHVQQGFDCVNAGVPVLIEKPLADSVEKAGPLVAAAEAAGVPILVGHHRRHNPLIRKAHDLISQGHIGDVRAVHSTCWFYKPDSYFEEAEWRKQKGAGPISVNLVHDVDLIRHLCGEVISVQAQAAPSVRGFDNEDVGAAVMKFANGAIGTITVSDSIVSPWSWELTSREYPIYPATPESCYKIGGSEGALSVPDLTVWNHKDQRNWWTPISGTSVPCEGSDPLINQMEHFAAVIQGLEQPLVSGAEGLKTLAVVEAIQTAASTGETVRLDPKA